MKEEAPEPTGLFFGTFNPVHIGHLAVANFMVEYAGLKDLWFMVTPQSPFKQKQRLLADRQRLEMVYRAIADDLRFRASDFEFQLPKPNYTAQTLMRLMEAYPERRFALILGADNLLGFNRWKNYGFLLENAQLLVYPRPGFDLGDWASHPSVHWVDAPNIEVSSSFIRKGLAEGKDLRFFMPKEAYAYAEEMGFYR